MQSRTFHTSDLDSFVAECDRLGTVAHPDGLDFANGAQFRFDTIVDEQLDPFSDAYTAQMIMLYEEIARSRLEQATTEQYSIDVDKHVAAAHPFADRTISLISSHVSAIAKSLEIADLPPSAKILDLGCGWGQTSELMAFCGADVVAADINPLFVDLVNRRAARLSLPIQAIRTNFDDITSNERFDLAFFYECLHHAIRPWKTIEAIAPLIADGGKIAFAGEPIQAIWWKNWGLRLDGVSIYCMRKFGWFESGWSAEFITECFRRNGFSLTLHPGQGLRSGDVGIATKTLESAHPSSVAAPPPPPEEAVAPPPLPEEAVAPPDYSEALNTAQAEIQRLSLELAHERALSAALINSLSWRLTAPLRHARKLLS